jgi:hypothetical protein
VEAVPDVAGRWGQDPLEPDAAGDEIVVTTTRRMLRLVVAASDAGARFAREDLACDPAAWMTAPRRLFDGDAAMDACQELSGFTRSILLHGLALGLDAAPHDVDHLLLAQDEEGAPVDAGGAPKEPRNGRGLRLPRPRLLSCWVDVSERGGRLFAFCALVTERPADLLERVISRYGAAAAAKAQFATGFDHSNALATAMISDAMADMLALAASDPESPLAQGLDVVVEQRFAA